MSRAQQTSTVEQNTGGAIASFVAGKNKIINGDFGIWQRGTSITYGGSIQYIADRWSYGSGNLGATISQQSSGLTGLPYAMRIQRPSGYTNTAPMKMHQNLESKTSYIMAGQTVTLSFYARAGANFSPSSSQIAVYIYSGTGTDENVDSSYTGQATVASLTPTLTTSWQRFTLTGTVASNATELALRFQSTPTGTAGTNDYYDITGVQLEIGAVATPFSTASGTVQGELALCQRYYWQCDLSSVFLIYGAGFSSSAAAFVTYLPVTMRTTPSASSLGTFTANENGVGTRTFTALGAFGPRTTALSFEMSGSSGLTVGKPLEANSGVIAISAEL